MFKAEIFTPNISSWEEIKETIILLESEAFEENAFSEKDLQEDFSNKNNIIFLLKKEETKEIIGFIYAKPIEDAEPARAEEKGETAYLWNMIIKKEYRGQKLAGVLMKRMEEELRSLNYKYMDLDAVTANNLSDNISKFYKDRIMKSEAHDSQWGPQVYFRIKL